MSFTDQKQWTISAKCLKGSWGGRGNKSKFRCGICGKTLRKGNKCRWIDAKGKTLDYLNSKSWFNTNIKTLDFFACEKCDAYDVLERRLKMIKKWNEIKKKYWQLLNFEKDGAIEEFINECKNMETK